jgi:hypothetical protein
VAYIPVAAGTNAASAAAAQKLRDEEEIMTAYKNDDLEGWEFKIMRSYTGKFKDNKFVQQLCQEEARAGWEMLEKFDDYRIRFKRRVDNRPNDQFLKIDPYRTSVGLGINHIMAVAVGIAALGVLVAVAMAIFVGK